MHVIFNLATTVLLLPFGNALARLACLLLPDREEVQGMIAGELELLDGEGVLQLDAFRQIDSVSKSRFRNFYEAADYVADRDTVAFGRFGVPMREIRNAVPAEYSDYVLYGWNSAADTVEVEIRVDETTGARSLIFD